MFVVLSYLLEVFVFRTCAGPKSPDRADLAIFLFERVVLTKSRRQREVVTKAIRICCDCCVYVFQARPRIYKYSLCNQAGVNCFVGLPRRKKPIRISYSAFATALIGQHEHGFMWQTAALFTRVLPM